MAQLKSDIPFLNEDQIRPHLHYRDLIPAMADALVAYSAGEIRQPDREMLPVAPHGGFFGVMPAVGKAMGLKVVNFFPSNAAKGLATHMAMIQLFDTETGAPLAVMDAGLITKMRTAAVSAAFLKSVMKGDEQILTIMGTGVQAEAHFDAMKEIHPFREIRIWGRTRQKAQSFAAARGAVAMDAEEAVRGADVVITATAATTPILDGTWLKQGSRVAAVGWNSKDGRELDDTAMANTIVVESRSGTSKESGNLRGAKAVIFAEAGEVIARTASLPAGETIIFDSIGMAVEDVFAANLVWQNYCTANA